MKYSIIHDYNLSNPRKLSSPTEELRNFYNEINDVLATLFKKSVYSDQTRVMLYNQPRVLMNRVSEEKYQLSFYELDKSYFPYDQILLDYAPLRLFARPYLIEKSNGSIIEHPRMNIKSYFITFRENEVRCYQEALALFKTLRDLDYDVILN